MIQIHVVSPGFQVTRRVVPRECFQKLSGCPFCRGVSGHREMHGTSAVMTENYEGEGELKCDGRYHEEVYGDQMLDVIVEKGSPRLGGRFAVPDHVFGDRGLRHLDTKSQEFAMKARSSPAGVGEAHFPDQIANFRSYRWATFATPTLPSPIEAKPLAMPGDDGLRFDKEQCRSPTVPQA